MGRMLGLINEHESNTDGSREPRDSMLELRTAKTNNFFDLVPNIDCVSDFGHFDMKNC